MPLNRYDPKTKSTFLTAATQARVAGKKWPEVHAAAKAAGYPGTVKGITRMLESAKKPGKPAKPAKAAAKPVAAPGAAAKRTPAKRPKPSRPKAGKRYSPKMKSAIMSAAIAVRGAGKKWTEAFQAAKGAGYRGSLQGIVKMIRAGNRKKIVRKPVATKPAAKRGPGRPKGSGKRWGRPALHAVSANGIGQIQAAVERIVAERVRGAIDRAIAALESAR